MQRSTVLVVDDDPYIVRFLQDALEEEGYAVATPLPTEAVDVARAMQPCVILLDLMMPLMDGAEVCRRLRLDPQTASIPVVIMSAQVHRLATIESDETLSTAPQRWGTELMG
jgi:CheY-like chemotaxis protein